MSGREKKTKGKTLEFEEGGEWKGYILLSLEPLGVTLSFMRKLQINSSVS